MLARQSIDRAKFSDLVHQIYAASAEPGMWPQTVAAVAQSLGAIQAILFTPYFGPGNGGLLFPWRVEEGDLIRYGTKYREYDLWAQAAQRKGFLTDCTVALDEELVPQAELLDSIYYREFLSPMGIGRLCSGVIFGGAPGLPTTVLSTYKAPDEPFLREDKELMSLLVPHLSRSLGLMHRLNHARYQVESLHGALNRLNVGVFLLNQALEVSFANSAAQEVLARGDGLSLYMQRKLAGQGQRKFKKIRLETWLADLVAMSVETRSKFTETFEAARTDVNSSYSIQCCSLAPGDPLLTGDGARFVVFVTDPKRVEIPKPEQLQAYFGLTAAEARVTYALMHGGTYKEVAKTQGVSDETVRTQIRSVFAKTGIGDKASLTRLVFSLSKATV